MNKHEEDLQKSIESGQTPSEDNMDVRAYQELFRALKKDPGYELSPRFAEGIVARVAADHARRNATDYFWFGAGIFFLLMASIGTIMFTGFHFDFGFLRVMSDYKGLAVFAVVFIILLNWIDKRFVRSRHAPE